MNAITKEHQTALSLPERAAVALGESANAAKLRELAAQSAGIVTVTNQDGRDEAHRAGMVLLKTRTSIRATGKAARDDATKFSKAVIAMEDDLIGIIEPEETRVLALRDKWDKQIAAQKAAKIAAEGARTEAIQFEISVIAREPLNHIDSNSAKLAGTIAAFEALVIDDFYAEFKAEAEAALTATLAKLRDLHAKELAAERAIAAAEEARKAEAARIEAERVELAKQRAENERVANEQAAERQRLANLQAAQELAAKVLAEKAAANLKAEQDALAEQVRIEREKQAKEQAERDRVATDTKRQLDEQQASIAAERAAFAREQEEATALAELAARLPVDHAEALEMNAALDAAISRIEPVETFTDDLARCTATAEAMLTNGRSLMSDSIDAYVGGGLADDADEPYIDYEAIAWAYQKLLAYGVGNTDTNNALMLDRLNLMLMTAGSA